MLGGMTMASPGGNGNRCGGKGFIVASLGHAGNKNKTQRSNCCRAGAAHRAPEGGNRNRGDCQPACHGADQRFHKRHDAGGNARALHYVARQNKEGDGQQGKLGYSCKKIVGKHVEPHIPLPHHSEGGKAQRKCNGHPQQQGDDKKRQQPECGIV